MRIGVAGPFNPREIKDYFAEDVNLPELNITASSVNIYVRSLLESGQKVTVFTSNPYSKTTQEFEGNNIKLYCIPCTFVPRGFGRYRMHRRIRHYVARELENLDVLHAEWTYEYALALLPYINIKPVFCSVRDWCPYILTIIKGAINKYYWYMSYYMFKKVMAKTGIHFIANSDYTLNSILEMYPKNNVTVIPNPIQSTYILNERTEYPENQVFVSISNSLVNVRKNYKVLLYAFREYLKIKPDSKLILIGSFSIEWENEMKKEGLLKNVELTGPMKHEDIFDVLDTASCLVHPSLEETFGNILLEAMCRKVPCIGGETSGAVPQVLGYGKYGLLCNVNDPFSIIDAMKKSDDAETMKQLTDLCTSYLKNTYSSEIVAQMHLQLFEKYVVEGENKGAE